MVIANADYGEHQLARVRSDALAMADALKRKGFESPWWRTWATRN
jgi:hypothetical protein